MKKERKKYDTETKKQKLIEEWTGKGWHLIEYQNHFDGNWLVFVDELPVVKSSIETRLTVLEDRVTVLEPK